MTVAATVALTVAVFGAGTWLAFVAMFAHAPSIYQSGRIELAGFVSVFGAALLAGVPPAGAYTMQAAASIVAAVLAGWIWWRKSSLPVRAAALLAGTIVAVPLALIYDLMIAAAGGLWLIRAGREQGFRAGDKVLLMAAFLVPLASRSLGLATHVPIGFLGGAIPLALCVRHARAERGASRRRWHPI